MMLLGIILQDNAFIFLLKPSDGIFPSDAMFDANLARSNLTSGHSVAWSDHDYVEVHAKDSYSKIKTTPQGYLRLYQSQGRI